MILKCTEILWSNLVWTSVLVSFSLAHSYSGLLQQYLFSLVFHEFQIAASLVPCSESAIITKYPSVDRIALAKEFGNFWLCKSSDGLHDSGGWQSALFLSCITIGWLHLTESFGNFRDATWVTKRARDAQSLRDRPTRIDTVLCASDLFSTSGHRTFRIIFSVLFSGKAEIRTFWRWPELNTAKPGRLAPLHTHEGQTAQMIK